MYSFRARSQNDVVRFDDCHAGIVRVSSLDGNGTILLVDLSSIIVNAVSAKENLSCFIPAAYVCEARCFPGDLLEGK